MLIARDERLARQAAEGDDRAFSVLYSRHHAALLRYCRSITGDEHDALDALQSAMLKALLALRRDARSGPVKPWLFRIAHNESITVLRRRPSSAPLLDEHAIGLDVHDRVVERQELASLLGDLRALTDHQRSALVLREVAGLDYEEIAGALETSPLAARQAVFAARSALHDHRDARDLTCDSVRRSLSDGGRRRGVRIHLRTCPSCRTFAREVRTRPRRLAALLPVPPAAAVLQAVLGSAAVGGGAVAASAPIGASVVAKAATGGAGGAGRARALRRRPGQRRRPPRRRCRGPPVGSAGTNGARRGRDRPCRRACDADGHEAGAGGARRGPRPAPAGEAAPLGGGGDPLRLPPGRGPWARPAGRRAGAEADGGPPRRRPRPRAAGSRTGRRPRRAAP